MEALLYRQIGDAVVAPVPDPQPAADEVVVKVANTGVCHTDIDILYGRYMCSFPVIPGHELAGTVVARGSGVSGVETGARVAVDPLLPCGECPACRAGRPSLCAKLEGYGATVDGGFAPLMAVKAKNVHSIGELPFHIGALAEPMACVMHGVDRVNVVPGNRALIFGAGPIGLMMMLGLKARGLDDIAMVDLEDSRLELAAELGAARTVNARALDRTAEAKGHDLVVDCTGVAEVCAGMPELARDGATILFFGVCPPDARAAFSPYEIFRRELTLIGSHSLSYNLPDAIDVLRGMGGKAERLVSHRLPLDAIARHLASPAKSGTMKVQYDAAA